MSSSGFVPGSSPIRVLKENFPSNAPLPSDIFPTPCLRSPFHSAVAFLSAILFAPFDLCVYGLHHFGLVALARSCINWKYFIDLFQFVIGQRDFYSRSVLFNIFSPFRSGDRNNVFALCKYPCKRKL